MSSKRTLIFILRTSTYLLLLLLGIFIFMCPYIIYSRISFVLLRDMQVILRQSFFCFDQLLAEKMPELLDFDKELVHLEAASKVCWLCF